MRILERAVYRGPHLYSATPMIRLKVDLGELENWPTNRLDGFAAALLERLPGLREHHCSRGQRGGLLERLREGTWLGHVAEHVALELQKLAGHAVSRGKTRAAKGESGVYNIMYAYLDEEVGLAAGLAALRLIDDLLPQELRGLEDRGQPVEGGFELAAAVAELSRMVGRKALGPTTAALVAAAERRGIPVSRLNGQSLIRLGWGSRQKMIRASITGETSLIATETAGDKDLTKQLLDQAGVPTPRGVIARSADEAVKAAARLRKPLVVKPLDGNHGRGVSLDLRSEDEIRWAFDLAVRHSRRVLVEEQFSGRDYRILVIGGKVAAVAERVPARVVGDGVHTVAELIEAVNEDPRRGEGHEKAMTRIKVDEHVLDRLSREGLALESVPEIGRVVQLRATANLSTGGEAIDRTEVIHPDNASIARRAAAIVGLDVAGIDFLCPDIARSAHEVGGGVIEVNAAPGFRMHLEPSEGKPHDVAAPVIDKLFPRGGGRIPLIAVTGTNGKSTTVRMTAHIFRHQGYNVGFTTTSGVQIGDETVTHGDASGPRSARMVLADPTVDVAVLECARGGILREGLGFDRCDVGMLLNVSADHLGLKGVDTVEDLAAVKSIVTESVSRRGVSIINADDPLTLRMARYAGGRVAYFTLKGGPEMSPRLQKHIVQGGLVAALEPSIHGGQIVLHDGDERIALIEADAIPATLGGAAAFNVANALAAALAAYAEGIAPAAIALALSTFTNSYEQSPGRLNVHDAHGFRVILDYAHNPAGLMALGEVIERLRPKYERVIGTISIPGDRRDEDMREMGAIAARLFDVTVFREKPEARGRPEGQVCELMRQGAMAAGAAPERLHCEPEERDAMIACLRMARPGDLVILTPTNIDQVWAEVQAFRPEHLNRGAGAALDRLHA